MTSGNPERRRESARIPFIIPTCFCRIELSNGFIEVEGKVYDISAQGIKLHISYKPSILDVIHLSTHFDSDRKFSKEISVVVRWCKKAKSDNAGDIYEVGCESRDQNVNIEQYIKGSQAV